MNDKDFLISIRDGLKSKNQKLQRKTLGKIQDLNVSSISNPNVLNILSDMLDFYIQTDQSMIEQAMSAFKHILG